MTFIEGIGDEVVYTFVVIAVLIVIILLWTSTSVNERVHRQVVVMDRARFQQFLMRLGIARARGGNRPMRHWRTMLRQVENLPPRDPPDPNRNDPMDSAVVESPPSATEARTNDPLSTDQGEHEHTEGVGVPGNDLLPSADMEASSEIGSEMNSANEDNRTTEWSDCESINRDHSESVASSSNDVTGNDVMEASDTGNKDMENDGTDNCDTEAKEGDLDTMRKLRVAFLERHKLGTQSSRNDVIDAQNADITNAVQIDQSIDASAENILYQESAVNGNSKEKVTVAKSAQNATNICDAPQANDIDNQGAGINVEGSDHTEQAASTRGESTEPLEGHIRVRIRYLDERQIMVQACPEDTLDHFKRTHFAAEVAENLRIRLIHNGRELRNDAQSLRAYHVTDNSVLHCLLSRAHLQAPPAEQHEQEEGQVLDIGFLVFPLFGFMLALIWYCRIEYRQYFNAISTLSLMGITFLYAIALLASRQRRHAHAHEHHD